jgi:uracil-DNA glycosylase family 4
VDGGGLWARVGRRDAGRDEVERADAGTKAHRRLSTVGSNRGRSTALAAVQDEVAACRRCPRLVEWREEVARTRKRSFADQTYWGRGVPGLGDPAATMVIVGLAPAAHGANRTGRMFTGDESGNWLFAALYKAGYASQPHSVSREDGLTLSGVYITAAVHCAPPGNKPEPSERAACAPYLARELDLLADARVVVALGQIGWNTVIDHFGLRPRPKFTHLAEFPLPGGRTLLGSYHPSQQNTFTGTLTEPMFDAVFTRARQIGIADQDTSSQSNR